jgi:Rnl2 family RNA ligase
MEFMKYTSIENSYREGFIYKVKMNLPRDTIFCVQEKIHGSNFSIWYDGKEFKFAKRTSFLQDSEDFFHYPEAIPADLFSKIHNIYQYVNCNELVIYGELFGGVYPHPEVKKNNNVKAIQKGVYYSPDIHFFPFDIKLDGEFLNSDDFGTLFNNFNIPHIKTLFTGTLDECLNYPNEFQTTIPEILGFPTIENNICEGVVIKPIIPKFLPNGERVILKNKNSKFSEKEHEEKSRKPKPELSQSENENLVLLSEYITENRLRNVISKIGSITEKDFGKLNGLFNKDILEDFLKDHEEKFNSLAKDSQKVLTKKMSVYTAEMIRNNFLNIIDGNF